MSEEYERGFKDGIAWAEANYQVIYHYIEEGGKKIYSRITGEMQMPKSFAHRSSLYDAGFGEGCITGRWNVREKEDLKKGCEKHGIIYNG